MGWHSDADRLTCNRIFHHLAAYSQRGFTGCLKVSSPGSEVSWTLHLCWGRLAWATGGAHPLRRWYRQLYLATGKKPKIPPRSTLDRPYWDYLELYRLSQEVLSPEQVQTILQGILAEVLFDLVQAFEQPLLARANGYSSLMDISVLAGSPGDDLHVAVHTGDMPGSDRFSPTWYPTIDSLRQQVQITWQEWVAVGLASHSPDQAPTIRDLPGLQRRTNPKAFENLVRLLDGTRTLRDIALRFRDGKDILKTARSLAPHICEGLIALDPIEDWLEARPTPANKPLVVCITRTRHTLEQVEFLAIEAGYQFAWLSHPFEALYKFEQQQIAIPTLLFATIDLLPLSGEEFCTLLRRMPALCSVPIVLHSRQPVLQSRQQELATMGVTELLYGDVLDAARLWQQLIQLYPATSEISKQQRQLLVSY